MNTNNLSDEKIREICFNIPKAELHMHLEGSFEPELMFEIAQRNKIKTAFESVDEVKEKYKFNNLKEFLDMYYEACAVLTTQQDFHDLTYAFFKKASSQGLKYIELFFDPQTHLVRNVSFETLIKGIISGCEASQKDFGVESNLIMCFLRDRTEEEGFNVLNLANEYKSKILGVGLDSNELGNPAAKFERLYKKAKELGYRLVAHAGEEGCAKCIRDTVNLLNVERIDHGCAIIKDEELIKEFAVSKMPLTMCPLSNLKLQIFPNLRHHVLKKLMDRGLMVMINSDDPAYFGGYVGDNYYEVSKALELSFNDIVVLAKNSFISTFLNDERKNYYVNLVTEYAKNVKID